MHGMNSESVDLIATDPPFNKGRNFHATPGSLTAGAKFQDRWSWEKDVHQDWIDQITDDHPKAMSVIQGARDSYGDDMGAFMCFMAVRLLAMRRILKPTGSIYLHCDPTASHYLKSLMDAVFGRKNFRNEIIWHYQNGGGRARKWFNKKHDVLLWYSKSDKDWVYNIDDIRVPYKESSAYSKYGTTHHDTGKSYMPNKVGKNPDDVWILAILNISAKERTGYPTQKPIELYERIIKASTNEGDVVLDPFCGCATTLVASERLGRQWVGIDIETKAAVQRLSELCMKYANLIRV